MALSVLNSADTAGGSATATVTFAATATNGNLLVVFMAQTVSTAAPTLSGYTVNSTSATSGAGLGNSTFVAYKISNGTETAATFTPGSGGVAQGAVYYEVAGGGTTTVDAIVGTANNGTALTTLTSGALTTTNAGSIVLAGVGVNLGSGTIGAWTGTGPMTNTPAALTTTRCIGGSYVPGSTLSAVTFTANWTTGRAPGLLVAAFTPSGGGASSANSQMMSMGVG